MAQDLEWAAERFALLSRRLRDAGQGGLRRELGSAIADAAKPVEAAIRAGLPAHMPSRYAGVLNAGLKITVYRRAFSGNPGVTITGRAPTRGTRGRAVRRLEGGVLGHPVFGMRSRANPRRWAAWVSQADGVTPEFFAGPAREAAPQVRKAVIAAVDRVTLKVTEG